MSEHDMQLETVHVPQGYPSIIQRVPGRWFDTDHGTVWTDNTDSLGFLPSDDSDAQIEQLQSRQSLFLAGLDADQAFEELLDAERDNNPSVEVVYGNLSEFFTDTQPVTAAAGPQDEYGVTLDDDGNVLELVLTNSSGVFIFSDDQWIAVDPEGVNEDEDTVYGREWLDVSAEILPFFVEHQHEDVITREQIAPFVTS